MALTGAEFAALTAWQQQAYLNGDPNYLAATGPAAASTPAPGSAYLQTPQIPSDIAQTVANPTFATVPFVGGSTSVEMTLDSHMAQWAASVIAYPQLRPADPIAAAISYAAGICSGGYSPPPDCSNMVAIATSYGQKVADAWASISAQQAAASTATPSAAASTAAPSPAAGAAPAAHAAAPVSTAAAAAAGAGPPPSAYGTLQPRALATGGGGDVGSALGDTVASFIPVIGPLLLGIFQFFFGGNAVAELAKAVQKLARQIATNEDQITQLAWNTAWGLGNLWIADAYIWDNFIDQFWTNFKNVWNALWKHLTQLIPLIIDQIRKLHDRFQQFYKKHILPNLKYLTYIRIFLAYLKLFHIKIFDRLDKIIGQIQGALFAPFLWMMRIVNLHGAWFNVVLAADLTIQKAIWIRTMTKYQGEMVNMWWAAQTNPVGIPPGGQGFLSSPGAPPGLVVSGAVGLAQVLLAPPMAGAMEGCIDFRQWAKSATGPIKQQVEDAAAVLLQILNL